MVQEGFGSSGGSFAKLTTQELYIIGGRHIAGKVQHLYQKTLAVSDWYICDSPWYRKAFRYGRRSSAKLITQELYIFWGRHIAGKVQHLYQKTLAVSDWYICDSLWYRKAFGSSGGSSAKLTTQELYIIEGRHIAGKVQHLYQKTLAVSDWYICDSLQYWKAFRYGRRSSAKLITQKLYIIEGRHIVGKVQHLYQKTLAVSDQDIYDSLWYRKAFRYGRGSPAKLITQELYIFWGRHIAGKVQHLYQKTLVVFDWYICDSPWYRKVFRYGRRSPAKLITQELYIIGGRHIAGKVQHLYQKILAVSD